MTAPLPPRPLTAGSYFPTTWDPIDSQTHHQIADSIIAIELSLLPGGKLSLQDHVAAADPHPQYSQGGGGLTIPLQQDLTFSPDGTFNIGTPGALRPKDLYLTGCVVMNGPDNSTGGWAEVPDYHLCTAYDPYDDTNALFIYNNTPNGDYTHLMLAPSAYEGSGSVMHIYANSDRANSALLELTPSSIHAVRTGSASAPQFELRVGTIAYLSVQAATGEMQLGWNGNWSIDQPGNLLAATDNAQDIGAVGATRPRSVYAGTSFIGPGAVPPGGSTGQVLTKTGSADYALGWGAGGGGGGVDANYVFTQGTPSATWVVVHNLNKYPAVDVVDTGGSTVLPSVHYDSLNQVTLTFGSATTGKAYMN